MKLLKAFIAAGIATGLSACASQSPPQGGPRDQTAPKLISSSPEDQQLNVDSRTITLTFDEEVQQNTLNKELLITPNINNPYKVTTDRNVMKLEFEKPLEDNTTYTFNFREGITDITEKNKAQGLRLSFSTGAYIDSSKVSGTVVNLMKQTPEKEALVLLYQAEDTLSVRKNRPYYLTSADEQGNFSLQNVKQGNYLMYALVDKNNNSFYDTEEERIAYLAKPITITPATDTIKMQTVRIDTKKPILLTRGKFSDRFAAGYNEGIQQFTAIAVTGKDTLLSKTTQDGKTMELFKTEKFNGGKAILAAVDTAGNIATDTLEIAFEGKPYARIQGAALKVMNKEKSGGYRVGEEVIVEMQTPVRITGKAPVRLMRDSVVVQEIKYPEQITLDPTKTELRFNMPGLSSNIRQVQVVLDSTAIQPLQGAPLVFPIVQVAVVEGNKGTGSLSGKITTDYTSYTLQLLDSEYKIVEERSAAKTFRFRNIAPGNYYLRVLIDENKNGRWDKADPTFKLQHEPVYMHPTQIEVRANWDVENLEIKF